MTTPTRVVRRPDTTLVTFGGVPDHSYRLSQRHVMQIEQQAGRALEFLSERELVATLQFLGIRPQALDAADQAVLASIRQQAAAAGGPAAGIPRATERPPVMAPPPSAAEPPADFGPPESQEGMARWRMIAGLLVVAIVLVGIILVLLFMIRTSGGRGPGGPEMATPTTTAGMPLALAVINTEVFAGPSSQYPVAGALRTNEQAPILGVSADRSWWLVEFRPAPSGQGWVSASAVRAQNAESVPVVPPPPLPTATPTPVAPTPTAPPPTAVIDGPTQAQVGQQIAFSGRRSTASAGANITRYDWDFGDGATSSGIDVTKVYGQAGQYNVRLTVTDDKGQQGQAVQQVTVVDAPTSTPAPPPTAAILGPSQALTGDRVVFDASSSTSVNPIVGYFWDFGDGSAANGIRVDHVFQQPGFYTVILTVQDSAGLTSSASLSVQVTEAATPTPPVGLENVSWQLENTLPATNITVLFRNGQVSGLGGCNSYTGSYVSDGQSLAISGVTATRQSCAPEIMQQEQRYLTSLAAAQTYQVAGGRLTIVFGGENQPGALNYTPAPQ